MQFSTLAMVAAAATAVSAWPSNGTITYTTEIVTALTTYCPESTQVTVGNSTYTVTKATTLTITDCPCTITKPVTVTPSIQCSTCIVASSKPVWSNGTTIVPPVSSAPGGSAPGSSAPGGSTTKATGGSGGSGASSTEATTGITTPTTVGTSSGNKVVALSGAGLAGVVALVAYVL